MVCREPEWTLRLGHYNHSLRQVANLFNKVILCVQGHVTMFIQVHANPFIGERIMNIQKWEVRRNVNWHAFGGIIYLFIKKALQLMLPKMC